MAASYRGARLGYFAARGGAFLVFLAAAFAGFGADCRFLPRLFFLAPTFLIDRRSPGSRDSTSFMNFATNNLMALSLLGVDIIFSHGTSHYRP